MRLVYSYYLDAFDAKSDRCISRENDEYVSKRLFCRSWFAKSLILLYVFMISIDEVSTDDRQCLAVFHCSVQHGCHYAGEL